MAYDIPLAKHSLLRDGDLRDAVNVGNELFWRNSCEADDIGTPIGAQFNGVNLGDMAIVYLTFESRVSIEPVEDSRHLLVQSTLSGNSSTRNGGDFITTAPKDIAVINPALRTRISFEPGCAHLVLKINRNVIATKLSELLRRQIDNTVAFDFISAQSDAKHHAWLETLKYLCAFYENPDHTTTTNKHVLQSHFDMVACTLLTSLRHNFSELLMDDRYTAAPRHIRRACEYIEEHIKAPFSMVELCQVTDVTERTLQNGFKKHLGQTPSAFIRSRRLHHIHNALLAAQAHTNVSRIMWDYGINNPGLWANLYWKQYGCYPSDTLNGRFSFHKKDP